MRVLTVVSLVTGLLLIHSPGVHGQATTACDRSNDDCVDVAICASFNNCICRFGFFGDGRSSGTGCTDINECTQSNDDCESSATCRNTVGSFTCTCSPGFTGDGRTSGTGCRDINECSTSNGGCSQTCVNTVGSFQCECGSGYFLASNDRGCNDINECSTSNGSGGCSQTCVNTVGSFRCDCGNGYTLASNGRGCNDINECSTSNGGCSQICVNTVGSFQCECGSGYTLASNGRGCNDINECSTSNGGCSQTCVNTVGSFRCDCGNGYTLGSNGRGCNVAQVVLSVGIVSSGTNNAGSRSYHLTCTANLVGSTDTPIFTWSGPPVGGLLPSGDDDTRVVSDVGFTNNGFTQFSVLVFDPLQASHEGIYTCSVTAMTATISTSVQLIVIAANISVQIPKTTDILTFGQDYTLSCTVTISGDDRLNNSTILYVWFRRVNGPVISRRSTLTFSSLSQFDAGKYTCEANISSTSLSQPILFQSNAFQVRLNGISVCLQWISTDIEDKIDDIISEIVQGVEQACECGFTRVHISEDAFQCYPESQQHVTFRARLTELSQTTTSKLISIVERWVSTTQTLRIHNTRLGINHTCSVVIGSINGPECILPLNSATGATTSTSNPTTGVIIGSTVGALLVLLAVTIIAVLIFTFVWKKRHKTEKDISNAHPEQPPSAVQPFGVDPYNVSRNVSYDHAVDGTGSEHEYEDITGYMGGSELNEEIGPQQQQQSTPAYLTLY